MFCIMSFVQTGLDEALALQFRDVLQADAVRVEAFAESSQYDELLAMKPVPNGSVILLALNGKGFHGQYTREWHSPFGNIYLCIKLEHSGFVPPQGICAAQYVAPLALVQVAQKYVDAQIRIKWINDLMLDGAKAAGTLTHYKNTEDKHHFYWGIGFNIVEAPECNQPTTCIAKYLKAEFKEYISSSEGLPRLYFMILKDLVHSIKKQYETYISDWLQVEQSYQRYLVK